MTVTCSHDPTIARPTATEVDDAISAAVSRIVAAGERMTEPRRRVLELLMAASEPVKAYDLISRFHPDGRVAKPATVYRALDFLEKFGLIHRLSSISSYVVCRAKAHRHMAAFLICDCCGLAREITPPQEVALRDAANAIGFTMDRVTLEIHGRCASCA